MGDPYQGMNGDYAGRLRQFIAAAGEAGFSIGIGSGYRSVEHQQRLWDAALKKYGDPEIADNWVARPGHSNHNKGIAADLSFGNDGARTWAHTNAARFGLQFPMEWEPWHIEPLGAARFGDRGAYTTPPPGQTHPGDVVDDPHDIGTQMGNMLAMLSGGGQISGTEMMDTPTPTPAPTIDDSTPDTAGLGEVA